VENLNPFAGELAARLVAAAGPGFETCFFCNSGAEAIEAALKTAMLATGRHVVAYADGGYHGTTLGALACMARGPYREDFDGVLSPFREVRFGDLDALEAAIAPGDVAAFLLEPIQVEAGVRIATTEFLEAARDLCRRRGTLLVLDEVQTGMGRTGDLFAFHGTGVAPDILVLAKSLGGGMVPIGAAVSGDGIWRRAYGDLGRCEIHASTFGGNALSCRVALATLEMLSRPAFLTSVRERGQALFSRLGTALEERALVRRIAWKGLLGGIELADVSHPWLGWKELGLPEFAGRPVTAALVCKRLFDQGILAQVCGHAWGVLRVEPPLTVDAATCERFVRAVDDAIRWVEGLDR